MAQMDLHLVSSKTNLIMCELFVKLIPRTLTIDVLQHDMIFGCIEREFKHLDRINYVLE